jgi:hypothetical protein
MKKYSTTIGPDNFEKELAAFAGRNEGACEILSWEPWVRNGVRCDAQRGPWMAWRDYRAVKGLGVAFMDHQLQAKKRWTVPCTWPHEFDGERTIADDMSAAGNYESQIR